MRSGALFFCLYYYFLGITRVPTSISVDWLKAMLTRVDATEIVYRPTGLENRALEEASRRERKTNPY